MDKKSIAISIYFLLLCGQPITLNSLRAAISSGPINWMKLQLNCINCLYAGYAAKSQKPKNAIHHAERSLNCSTTKNERSIIMRDLSRTPHIIEPVVTTGSDE